MENDGARVENILDTSSITYNKNSITQNKNSITGYMKINNGWKGFTQGHKETERAFTYLLNHALLSHLYSFSFSYNQSKFCF